MFRSQIVTCALLFGLVPPSISQHLALVPRATTHAAPAPISVAPSQYWEGDDGPWSSFTLRVGTPAQDVRTFISTSSQVSWIVLEGQGCRRNDAVCANARGGLYNMNASSTWQPNGFWQLGNERNLGLFANGLFGNETLGLGIQGSGGPTLTDQIMAVIGTEKVYLGMFAVNPKRTNYTGITEQGQASYMTNLKNQSLIPSLSFAYTAGASYRLKKVLGSLTLGGYDQSRFTPNNMSFSFAPDNDRDLVVGIQSISSTNQDGTTHDLLPTGINAYVDSTVAQIWLPEEACRAFEKAFGLTYDPESNLYPVSSTLHKKLLAQNASITFTLGNSISGGQTIKITLPYDSFDLQAQPPFTVNATRYFPLQRAANETQYTLGRTFLQEAYLIVDWERSNFSISQCLFDPDHSQEKLISIKPVNGSSSDTNADTGTRTGRTIGIAVGIAVAVVLFVAAFSAYYIIRKRKRRRQTGGITAKSADDESEKIRQGFAKAELDTELDHALYEMGDPNIDPPTKAPTNGDVKHPAFHAELVGDRMTAEMNGSNGQPASELPSYKGFSGPFHEMYDPSIPPVELPAHFPQELPASPLPAFSRSSSAVSVFRSANNNNLTPVDRSNGSSSPSSSSSSSSHQPFRTNRPSQIRPPPPRPHPSRVQSIESHSSGPSSSFSSSARVSGGLSQSDGPASPSSRQEEPSSPISPLRDNDERTDREGLFSLVRRMSDRTSQPRRSSRRRNGENGAFRQLR